MTGTELRKLRETLPKPTTATEIARRLGHTRQWVSFLESKSDEIPEAFAAAYRGAIEALRLEQAGHEIESVDVLWWEIMAEPSLHTPQTYNDGLYIGRSWMRGNPALRDITLTGLFKADDPADVETLIGVIDALDRAGVRVSFRTEDGVRVIRSRP